MLSRTLAEVTAAGDRPWFEPALRLLEAPPRSGRDGDVPFLRADAPVVISRAPGRLDVMGGIADYSGSLVLQLPLARATFVLGQRQAASELEVLSLRDGGASHAVLDLRALVDGPLRDPVALAAWFAAQPGLRWASYIAGVVQACLARRHPDPDIPGLRLLVTSEVPEGKGISSSAALEVACMHAVLALLRDRMSAVEVAAACQRAENVVARAPCGIMDQVTASCGRHDRLLQLLCQPDRIEGHLPVPAGLRLLGVDSGVRHAVTGADYLTVRAAAFMGYRMIAHEAGLPVMRRRDGVDVQDDRWHGYLANIEPEEFARRFAPLLPERMSGAGFLSRFGGTTDTVTRVDPGRVYPVRQATAHPVFEHPRVRRFASLLTDAGRSADAAVAAGALMYASHASYGACGLGSDGTDRLAALARDAGPARGVFGARITGGGSGGTVAILASEAGEATVHELAARYARETGHPATVFSGSGPGAAESGVLVMRPAR